ncbi:MAG: SpoIIE family protein phosphatase [Bacilli bacterium]|nr:SpoIIE family protein phosphatase [Bacilli bacterium]
MEKQERNKYVEAYLENEYDANKQMTFALAFCAILLGLLWIGYLTNLFVLNRQTKILVNIVFPVSIAFLLEPLFFLKTKFIKRYRFKYFVLFELVFIIALLNIVIPKHAIIAWVVCIVLTNHYYNPKVGKIIFIITIVAMLLCIYAAMFLGEYDPDLLMGETNDAEGIILSSYLPNTYPDTPLGRLEYLHDLKALGYNRYLTAFVFYYLARLVNVTIIFFISNALNKRTYKLFVDEIKVNSEQERTKAELNVAKDIQLQSLPKEFVMNKDIEIQAELKAARTVGGDFYDYFLLDSDHVAILIGDVSGKGIGAAMFMMKAITCFKNAVSIYKTPKETLEEVNRNLFIGNDSNMFVTCFYAIVNVKTGEVKFANAGHTRPIVGKKGNYRYLKCNSGFVIGGLEEAFVMDEEFKLEKGETITLYTDGITEAKSDSGELYGENRLLDFFNKKIYSCLVELHAELKDNINEFATIEEQTDDITYITLKFHGDEYAYEEKMFTSKGQNVQKMIDFLRSFAEKHHFEESFVNNLSVVSDELLSNICKYGYPDKPGDIYIRALYNFENKEFILTIIDKGIPFNPFTQEEKEVSGDVSEIKEGGLGILIVKKLMSEYAYDHINKKNIVTLKKTF